VKRTNTVIIGAGQAGLAMSRYLNDWGIDHVVLERGRIAERWRSERWDSLRLLTPNWQARLPGFRYTGDDPDGYMTMAQTVGYLERYAAVSAAPVQDQTTVLAVDHACFGFRVTTDQGVWQAANVVIATGYCDVPSKPAFASGLAPSIHQLAPTQYRRPSELPPGGVLVVGASASGVQLADELAQAGRDVSLAVGRHTRLPRVYRERDIMWWFENLGVLNETTEAVYDLAQAKRQPSLQLVGRPERSSLDLQVLQDRGVRLLGRATGIDGTAVGFAGDLTETTQRADHKLARLLDSVDRHIAAWDLDKHLPSGQRPAPVAAQAAATTLDLADEGIGTVLWATGFTRRYPWLNVSACDRRGEIVHSGGVTNVPGLYVLGLQLMRSRKSSFIDGVGDDARALANHIGSRLVGSYANAA